MKLVEAIKLFGGLGGLASLVFLIYDRVVRSKPLAYLIPQEYRVHLRVINMTRETVIVDRVTTKPPGVVELVWGSDTRSELEAAAAALWPSMADDERAKKFLVLRPSEERSLAFSTVRLTSYSQVNGLQSVAGGETPGAFCRYDDPCLFTPRRMTSLG